MLVLPAVALFLSSKQDVNWKLLGLSSIDKQRCKSSRPDHGEAARSHIVRGISLCLLTRSNSTTRKGRLLDHNHWGGISITNCERANISTSLMGRHLDRNLGEASQSQLWEGNHLDHNLGEASRPQPWGGISITFVRGVLCDVWKHFVLKNDSFIKREKIEWKRH